MRKPSTVSNVLSASAGGFGGTGLRNSFNSASVASGTLASALKRLRSEPEALATAFAPASAASPPSARTFSSRSRDR